METPKAPARIIVGFGMPGSGKTTLLKPIAEELGLAYVNRDDIRQEIFNDASVQFRKEEVWDEADRRVRTALSEKRSVIYDATFAEQGKRRDFLSHLRNMGWERIVGVYVNTDPQVARERNRSRDRVVPAVELEQYFIIPLSEHPPEISDGFDELYTLDTFRQFIKSMKGE